MQIVMPHNWEVIGEEQITVDHTTFRTVTAATAQHAQSALFIPEVAAVRYTLKGGTLSQTVGLPLDIGESLWIRVGLDAIRFLSQSGINSAIINAMYFR